MIHIDNHGPLIRATNFWQSEVAKRGLAYLSVNAGAFRLLLPNALRPWINEMRPGAKHVIVTFGGYRGSMAPGLVGKPAIEWMVEDGTADPWACWLDQNMTDRLPAREEAAREWLATVWDNKKNRPHKALERPAYVRFTESLPCLKPLKN